MFVVGGPVKYAFKDDCTEISSEWLYEHVILSIRERFPKDSRLCNVLAMALLYACMEDDILLVPDHIKTRVRTAYNQLHLEPTQPITKIPLVVRRREDQLLIDEVVEIGNGLGGQQVHGDHESFQSIQYSGSVQSNRSAKSLRSTLSELFESWDQEDPKAQVAKCFPNDIIVDVPVHMVGSAEERLCGYTDLNNMPSSETVVC